MGLGGAGECGRRDVVLVGEKTEHRSAAAAGDLAGVALGVDPRGAGDGGAEDDAGDREAAAGGPIALVRDGDPISLDIPARRLDLLVDGAELARRRAEWAVPGPKIRVGWLSRYARLVTSANTGAVLAE